MSCQPRHWTVSVSRTDSPLRDLCCVLALIVFHLSAVSITGAASREVVTIKHVQNVFQALAADKLVAVLNEMSPPLCRYLVVALFVNSSYLEQQGFSLSAIVSAFNAYLVDKGQGPQPTDRVRGYLEQLVSYAVVKTVKESQDANKVGAMLHAKL